jgi:hypothetical protein
VEVADRLYRLDRPAPPPKPTFPDEIGPLSNGEGRLPLDASPAEMRRGSLVQMKDLTDRLKRFEQWKREQQ